MPRTGLTDPAIALGAPQDDEDSRRLPWSRYTTLPMAASHSTDGTCALDRRLRSVAVPHRPMSGDCCL